MNATTVEQGFNLRSDASFEDGGGHLCSALDIVQYRFGQRRGILLDVLQDGDAYVVFRDTKAVEIVKWKHLCKVPEYDSLPD